MMENMDDFDIIPLARQAGNDYYGLYGKFPDRIYVHAYQLSRMRQYNVVFASVPRLLPLAVTDEINEASPIRIDRHIASFVAVGNMPMHDVYVDMPELPDYGLRSGQALARMAKSEYDVEEG